MENSGATSRGFVGTLNNVQLADVLQMCCIGGTSTAIRVTKDEREGIIYLVEGEIVHAEAADITGQQAFFEIMSWNQGNFESLMGRRPKTTTIEHNWQHLLMEACRRQDEDSSSSQLTQEPSAESENPALAGDSEPIRVLIVDDSAMMRKALAKIFDGDTFQIVGNAVNGEEALDLIPGVQPDVVTMDVNMPVMDGISALKRIMIQFPLPTVMVSAMTQDGATITFDALKYGAVDFIPKPSQLNGEDKEEQHQLIRQKVRLASEVAINSVRYIRTGLKVKEDVQTHSSPENVVCLVAAEGGYGALLKIVPQLTPELSAAFVVVLYAEPEHVDAFAHYLDLHSQIQVKRAMSGDQLQGGVCYLVSGKEYGTIESLDDGLRLHLTPSSFPERRGAADILMISLAEKFGNGALGVVLSGAATDGSDSLGELLHMGGDALIQSPQTCLLKEMVEAAIAKCAGAKVVDDDKIASEITRIIQSRAETGSLGGANI